MRSYRWDGTVTAVSSLAHGGDVLGTVTYLRREQFLDAAGARVELPVVSGNALRGVLRDCGADLFWEAHGFSPMLLGAAHALWSGGALVKAKGQPLTGSRLQELRRLVPQVGVFGAAGGGRIIDGCLQVGKLVPICAETAHILPPALRDGPLPSLWDLLQVEYFTRYPGVPGESVASTDVDTGDGDPGLMRYGVETFVAGTRFHAWFALSNATGRERAFFGDALERFSMQARVGGRAGSGHGQISLDLTERVLSGAGEFEPWRPDGADEQRAVVEALAWLD